MGGTPICAARLSTTHTVCLRNKTLPNEFNAEQVRKDAEVLKIYEERMVEAYSRRSGKSTEVVKALMAAETWYYGRQIVDAGFCDELHERFGLVAAKLPRLAKAKAMYSRLLISMMRDWRRSQGFKRKLVRPATLGGKGAGTGSGPSRLIPRLRYTDSQIINT